MVKLPDKESLEGFTKKVGEAVKLPDEPEKNGDKPEISKADEERIRKEERERLEKERQEKEREIREKENEEKAKAYEKIEAEKKAEQERLAEEARKKKEQEEWAREEEKKKLEEEKKRAQIEKEVIARQKKEAKEAAPKKGHAGKIVLAFIIILLIIVGAAYGTLVTGNSVLNAYGYPLSYSGQYDVLIPDSQKINFGPIPVQAITSGNAVTLSIDNDRQTIQLGESATFPAKHVIITMLGMNVYDADFQVTVTYLGVVTNRDDFKVILKTSQPIPGWLISIMKPSGVDIIST